MKILLRRVILMTCLLAVVSLAIGAMSGQHRAFAAAYDDAAQGVAVNSGGDAVGSFSADNYFGDSGGGRQGQTYATTDHVDTNGVPNAAPEDVYRTERWCDIEDSTGCQYTFTGENADHSPVVRPGSTYLVRLHFAEIYFTQPGQRQFSVWIGNLEVLPKFDIVAQAGGPNKAIVKDFQVLSDTVQPGVGSITVRFVQGAVNHPKISGIEIMPVQRQA